MELMNQMLEPMISRIGSVLPGVIGAILVLIVGLLVARGISKLVYSLLKRINLEKHTDKYGQGMMVAKPLSKVVYFFLSIFVMLIVLDMLGVNNVFEPLEAMLQNFFAFIPNIVAAAVIGYIGYFLAKLVSEGVGILSNGINNLSYRLGFDPTKLNLTKIAKQVVFIFVFVPILIIALDALQIKAISEPATEMLSRLVNAVPNILAAAIIIGVFFILGKFVVETLSNLLRSVGADTLPSKMGISSLLGNTSLSKLISNAAYFFIMFAAIISALEKLEMTSIVEPLQGLISVAGKIIFGLVVMMIGVWLGNIIKRSLATGTLGTFGQVAAVGFFFAIALKAMGIADSIVNLAFGLTLGAVAVAFALSFGLGGREAAGRHLDHLLGRFRDD